MAVADSLARIWRCTSRENTRLPLLEPKILAIFDHDGVLVDSLAFHQDSWVEMGRLMGLAIAPEFIHETFGMTNPTILRSLLGDAVDSETIRNYSNLKEECYRTAARGRIVLTPGARELLDALTAEGAALGIGSSAVRANLELTIGEAGLSGRFAAVVGLEDIERGKPDPEVFLKAAIQAGVEPCRCVVFEDAPVGVQAAKSAGMLAIGVASTHPAHLLEQAGADEVVPNLVGFPVEPLVARLRRRERVEPDPR
jgi:beta-phosphoglucomutase